jgi:uncharacterized protein
MTEHIDGVPCWADLAVPDVEAAKRFYGGLFGWTFADADPDRALAAGSAVPGQADAEAHGAAAAAETAAGGPYATAFSGPHQVAAIAPRRGERQPVAWTLYLAAGDVAATVRRIGKAGGTLLAGPDAVGGLGTVATVADPEGAVFGLWQSAAHSGFGQTRRPGSFTWFEVHVHDTAGADAFYEGVFGYSTVDAGEDLRLWAPAGTAFGPDTAIGGRKVQPDAATPAYVEPFFGVADCDTAARKAADLGGTVLQAPFDTPFGRLAVLADDQGAVFVVEAR